jgi:hypothetical protein
LYAGAAGVSPVALLASVAFWTWLWGPLGLVLATPLTVCLIVLGKHVPGLEFLGTLLADTPALAPEYGYYQRLLARDQSEAADLIERYIKTESPRSVYDALLLTARCVARPANPGGAVGTAGAGGRQHASAAGYRGESRGLDAAGDPDVPGRARGDPAASELLTLVLVCFADLPPSLSSKTRCLVKTRGVAQAKTSRTHSRAQFRLVHTPATARRSGECAVRGRMIPASEHRPPDSGPASVKESAAAEQ